MAQFTIANILVHNAPSGTSFSDGDEIEVYYDDSTESILTDLNGTPAVLSDTIGEINTNYTITGGISSFVPDPGGQANEYVVGSYSFCDTTTLVWFRMPTSSPEYPYFEEMQTANSPVCDVGGGAVCDIHFTGPLQITHATTITAGNGQVTASATSSNADGTDPVKYGLTDFDYATEGQTSGTITGLVPGSYTLYAKDKNDCTAFVPFTILYKPAFGEHYRYQWTPLNTGRNTARTSRIRIYEREYFGQVVEKDYAGSEPFKLNKPKQGDLNDKFFPVHPTTADLSLMSTVDYEWLSLYTQDDQKYRVDYEMDTGDGFELEWSGFIAPSVGVEPFVPAPYPSMFTVVDNIKALENQKFTDASGNLLNGSMKLIKVLAFVLKKTGLFLPIRSGINIFETTQNTAASDDPLDQTFVDVACYRTPDGEPFNCFEVLEKILAPFVARIYQDNGQWCIEEIDRAHEGYAYRVFDADGNYSSNGTLETILDINAPEENNRVALTQRSHNLEFIPAYGKVELTRKYNYVGSIIAGGFEKTDLLSPSEETFSTNAGVFTSEEGFKDWTLRLNGTTGVSFGRMELREGQTPSQLIIDGRRNTRGSSGPRLQQRFVIEGANIDRDRSVGAFFYSAGAWSGNLRDAYIESAAKPFQYGPGDAIKFQFEFANDSPAEYPFGVIRFGIKIGDNWLQNNSTWDDTENIYKMFPTVTGDFKTIDLEVPVPDTDTVVDSTIQVKIYYYTPEFYEFGLPSATNNPHNGTDGTSALKSVLTANIATSQRADVRVQTTIGTTNVAIRAFCELIYSLAAESFEDGIFHPNDYNSNTNPKVWKVTSQNLETTPLNASAGSQKPRKFYVDNVTVDGLINGQPPPYEDKTEVKISDYLSEVLELELYHSDVPNINNAVNMYNNYFRLSDGTPTRLWVRSGIAEAQPLHAIYLSIIAGNYAAPTFRLTGQFMYEFGIVGLHNRLRLTKPGSNLALTNTTFDSDLSGWEQTGTGTSFTWTADNDGSAEVELTGSTDSKKLTQSVDHTGGFVTINTTFKALADSDNDREDVVFFVFYRGSEIVQMERGRIIQAPTSDSDYTITDYKVFVPSFITSVGFYIHNIAGAESVTYQVTEFDAHGADVQEIYQIADYNFDDMSHSYTLELQQISKALISLQGTDTGGDPQGGGEPNNPGSGFSRAYSDGYGSGFA